MDSLFSITNHIQHNINVIISKTLIKKTLINECLKKLKQYQLDLTNLENEKLKLTNILNSIPINNQNLIDKPITKLNLVNNTLEANDKINYDVLYDTVNFDPFFKFKILEGNIDTNSKTIFYLNGFKFYDLKKILSNGNKENYLIIQKDKEIYYYI